MLRHLKMEFRKQQEQQQQQLVNPIMIVDQQKNVKAKRVRGRRSSKPQMEKRRRARINECLEILKTYVLTDSNNLTHLGINIGKQTKQGAKANALDNNPEESIACQILKSSGLINRHKGRKNPNKLEKADILELTVDYVKRLHEQRNKLILSVNSSRHANEDQQKQDRMSQPLGPFCTAMQSNSNPIPLSPPPSSASNSPQPLLTIMHNHVNRTTISKQQQSAKLAHMLSPPIQLQQQQQMPLQDIYKNLQKQKENVDIFYVKSDIQNDIVLDLTKASEYKY